MEDINMFKQRILILDSLALSTAPKINMSVNGFEVIFGLTLKKETEKEMSNE